MPHKSGYDVGTEEPVKAPSVEAFHMARAMNATRRAHAPTRRRKVNPFRAAVEGGFINDRSGRATRRLRQEVGVE